MNNKIYVYNNEEMLPDAPGVYLILYSKGNIERPLYNGQSKNIRKRIHSHISMGTFNRASIDLLSTWHKSSVKTDIRYYALYSFIQNNIENIYFGYERCDIQDLNKIEKEKIKHHKPIFNSAGNVSYFVPSNTHRRNNYATE